MNFDCSFWPYIAIHKLDVCTITNSVMIVMGDLKARSIIIPDSSIYYTQITMRIELTQILYYQ